MPRLLSVNLAAKTSIADAALLDPLPNVAILHHLPSNEMITVRFSRTSIRTDKMAAILLASLPDTDFKSLADAQVNHDNVWIYWRPPLPSESPDAMPEYLNKDDASEYSMRTGFNTDDCDYDLITEHVLHEIPLVLATKDGRSHGRKQALVPTTTFSVCGFMRDAQGNSTSDVEGFVTYVVEGVLEENFPPSDD
jgi:hypothetical protein